MDEIKNMSKWLIPGADVLYALEVFVHKAAHFGQYGEDAIVESFFSEKKIQDITYLEIGIPSPINLSNTYHFYLNGNKGVCIEANSNAIADLERVRPRDKIVSCGVGGTDEEGKQLDFFIMKNHPEINTFSRNTVSFWEAKGYECERVIKVPVFSLNTILERYFDKAPEFISIDIEGYEYQVLKDLDFTKWQSQCFCIETGEEQMRI